jgi:hypothetical protein
MKPNECRANDDSGQFRITHWILLSAQSQVPGSRTVVPALCRSYTDQQPVHREIYTLCEVLIASEGRLAP